MMDTHTYADELESDIITECAVIAADHVLGQCQDVGKELRRAIRTRETAQRRMVQAINAFVDAQRREEAMTDELLMLADQWESLTGLRIEC